MVLLFFFRLKCMRTSYLTQLNLKPSITDTKEIMLIIAAVLFLGGAFFQLARFGISMLVSLTIFPLSFINYNPCPWVIFSIASRKEKRRKTGLIRFFLTPLVPIAMLLPSKGFLICHRITWRHLQSVSAHVWG